MSTAWLQRDPSTGRLRRDAALGKLRRVSSSSTPCCCAAVTPPPTCDCTIECFTVTFDGIAFCTDCVACGGAGGGSMRITDASTASINGAHALDHHAGCGWDEGSDFPTGGPTFTACCATADCTDGSTSCTPPTSNFIWVTLSCASGSYELRCYGADCDGCNPQEYFAATFALPASGSIVVQNALTTCSCVGVPCAGFSDDPQAVLGHGGTATVKACDACDAAASDLATAYAVSPASWTACPSCTDQDVAVPDWNAAEHGVLYRDGSDPFLFQSKAGGVRNAAGYAMHARLRRDSSACTWVLEIYCQASGADVLIWSGRRKPGKSPAGSYARTGGCATTATVTVG